MSEEQLEERRGGLTLTTDLSRMDLARIRRFLAEESYWARGIPEEVVARSLAHSLNFGVLDGGEQVAFARVVTDRATFGWLCDVFVAESHRGRGLAKWMMEAIDRHPELQGLRRWNLATKDAHPLYAQFGYQPLAHPERHMERTVLNPYLPPES